ncbi:mitotic spindle assembly checkpoint protein MAD2B [Elysia marginata]|uniref:Mitotic spindle assembly checkpoint protein MAD2B n=1 Tax=Elysia marginata TaxID=1093978 RepID=A0AAV4G447_9GAST|nr:mitotic spindle assembly checkpoint protein MAD2B [Elysia marginata]
MSEASVGVDILSEFVEVCIHCVLYCRGLYPQGVFEKRVKYNVPVQMCLHPDVCAYITNVVNSIKMLLTEGQVDKISVVILEEQSTTPLERFVIELGTLEPNWTQKDPHLFQTEQALRGFLLKLNVSDALLHPASKDVTWTVHVHTRDSTLSAVDEQFMQKDFPWMEAEEKQQQMKNSKLVPLKSYDSDWLHMQLYAEETDKKS